MRVIPRCVKRPLALLADKLDTLVSRLGLPLRRRHCYCPPFDHVVNGVRDVLTRFEDDVCETDNNELNNLFQDQIADT